MVSSCRRVRAFGIICVCVYWFAVAGYSTDRGEKYHIDVSRSNTLDLKDRKKPKVLTGSQDDMDSSAVPMAGFEDDQNLTAVQQEYDNDDVRLHLSFFCNWNVMSFLGRFCEKENTVGGLNSTTRQF